MKQNNIIENPLRLISAALSAVIFLSLLNGCSKNSASQNTADSKAYYSDTQETNASVEGSDAVRADIPSEESFESMSENDNASTLTESSNYQSTNSYQTTVNSYQTAVNSYQAVVSSVTKKDNESVAVSNSANGKTDSYKKNTYKKSGAESLLENIKSTNNSASVQTESAVSKDDEKSLSGATIIKNILKASGHSEKELSGNQLVVVKAMENTALLSFFKKSDGKWSKWLENTSGFVGKNGTVSASEKVEGDKKTPTGIFSLDFSFGGVKEFEGNSHYRRITKNSVWVDDKNSVYYNKWVETDKVKKDWNSAEILSNYADNSYKYSFVVGYNRNPIVKGKGSAIFFHCGKAPTAGCISIAEENMYTFIKSVDFDENPQILIY